MRRPPLLGRILASLLIGEDSDVVRGDIEEAYRHRIGNQPPTTRHLLAYYADVLRSILWWWRPQSVLRRHRRATYRAQFAGGSGMISGISQDLRYVYRNLIRRPAFAMAVIVTLGLGIGATTTIYSVVDAVLVRPLPYPEAGRLVSIGNTVSGREWRQDAGGLQRIGRVSVANFMDWKQRARSFQSLAAVEMTQVDLRNNSNAVELARAAFLIGNLFDVFQTKPAIGRFFTVDDVATPTEPIVVLSYGAWVRRYGADPEAIKQTSPWKIVGVLPPDFRQPEAFGRAEIEFWFDVDPEHDSRYLRRDRQSAYVFGLLRPGVTLDAARREMNAIQAQVAREFPVGNVLPDGTHYGAGVNNLHAEVVGASGRTLWIFLAASTFLLLIAGLNAANLLFIRGLDRKGEISVRQALGASRVQLVRGMLIESLLLALAAGGAGIFLAHAGVEAFVRFGPASLPRISDVAVNWRILVATTVLSVGTGLVVGLFPALRITHRDIAIAMRRSAATTFAKSGARARQVMVVAQLALAVLLCVGACLLINSYIRLLAVNPGFEPDRLTTFAISMKRPGANISALWLDWDELRRRIKAIPGIESLAFASNVPFQSSTWSPSILLPGDPPDARRSGVSAFVITPDYFESMRIKMKAGRPFGPEDKPNTSQVAIVNEALVREYLHGRPAVGSSIRIREANGDVAEAQIVGVVADLVQTRPEEGWLPAVYVPYTQKVWPIATAALRSDRPQEQLVKELREAIVPFTPFPMIDLARMEDRIGLVQTAPRFNALLIGTFASVAILLAAVGLYGAIAHSVGRRTRELGIRMAVGADTGSIFKMILREGLVVSAIGLGLGLIAAVGLTRFLTSFLFEVNALDPLTLVAASVVLSAVVLLAVLRPALQAARVDPLRSLKAE